MNPNLLREALAHRARLGTLPKAVVLVHLYGQSADLDPILEACNHYDVPLIEDAAESLGATYKGAHLEPLDVLVFTPLMVTRLLLLLAEVC
jgi:pyridoxal phosphate-dependent aminotransferase EpsN